MRIILSAAIAAVLLCSGCASVTQGTTHNLRIDTQTRQGEEVRGADCKLTNDHGTTVMRSGQTSPVRRSSKDLEISCSASGHKEATARLVSRANAGMAGNIIIGGAIGAMVDHSSGAAYTYPSWVRLVFGEYLVADRKDEIDGTALGARPPTSVSNAERRRPTAAGAQGLPATQPAQAAAPPRPTALVYTITDRNTRGTQTVTLGAGNDVRALGELGIVTPADGWGPVVERGGRSRRNYASIVNAARLFELDFDAGGEEESLVDGRPVRTVRIGISGWTVLTSSFAPVRAPYSAVAWYSPELERVLRFEVRARGAVGSTALMIDETLELAGGQRADGASQAAVAVTGQQAAMAPTRALETHEYRIVDRTTNASQTVVLSLDRLAAEGRTFNAGARVEAPGGQPTVMKSALVGELDLVTPPGGWADIAENGRPGFRYDSMVQGVRRNYRLDFHVAGEQDLQVGSTSVPAVRIAMNGWVTQMGAGSTPSPVPYSATAWYAPSLQRVVRFEAKARSSTPYVGVSVDEMTELVASSVLVATPAPTAAPRMASAPGVAEAAAAPPVSVAVARTPATGTTGGARAALETYEYRITDRRGGGARLATLHVEAVGTGAKTFNGGQRVESVAGEPLLMQAALTGELDFATPPGGWAALAQKPRSRLKFPSMVSSAGREYELEYEAGREEDMQIAGLPLRVVRIQMEGWLTTGAGTSPARTKFSGTAWYAPALKRVVRFEGKSPAVDEILELVAFSLRKD